MIERVNHKKGAVVEQEENNALTPQLNEELNAAAEFQGNKDDEEDVLLTAQRYLNIFHQIHIFKEFRKKQFDEELLQVPHEIRKIIALLPGGRILLEHIAELAQERNIDDPALATLLKSLEGKGHFSDNSISIASPEPTPMLSPVAGQPVLTAPIELGGDFTKALTDSFNTYSQNLRALTVNIQKMAATQQSAPAASGGQVGLDENVAKSLTDSFDAYTQNIRELTQSVQKMVEMQQSSATSGVNNTVEIGGKFAKSLTDSFDAYTQNIRELTESVQKLAITQQTAPAAIGAPVEIGGEFAKSLTDSFEAYTQNIRELTESVQKLAITHQPAPAAIGAPVEISGEFTKSLTDSFDAYTQNIRELTANIQKLASNSTGAQNSQTTENILPEFKDSISAILRENANQQMNVLKNFGETLSKTIMESQKELITSLKNSTQNSMLVGKIMQFPFGMANNEQETVIINEDTAQNTATQNASQQTAPEPAKITHQQPAVTPADLNSTQPTNAENTSKVELKQPSIRITTPKTAAPEKSKKATPENTAPEKSKKATPEKTETTKTTENSNKNNLLKSMGEKLSATKNKLKESLNVSDKKEKAENKEDKKQSAAETPKKEKAPKNTDNTDIDAAFAGIMTPEETPIADTLQTESTDVDINDVFAQLSGALSEDFADGLTESATAAIDKKAEKKASYIDDFENDVPQQPAPVATDFSAAFDTDDSAQTSDNTYNNEMSQIRDALNSSEQISLDDLEVKPVSLNPDDNADISQSFKDFTGQDFNDSFADAFADNDTAQNVDTETADDAEWEYVDEDGNPVSDDTDGEWEYEYVDENGDPITDDNTEWEYVDEDGNPISADDNTEWEYVDEDGNPITPDGDDEWEYEYVDEDENTTK